MEEDGVMMSKLDQVMKWAFTFFLLLVTIWWARFTVLIVQAGIESPDPTKAIEGSGASLLLGSLITWDGMVIQFYFRKKTPDG